MKHHVRRMIVLTVAMVALTAPVTAHAAPEQHSIGQDPCATSDGVDAPYNLRYTAWGRTRVLTPTAAARDQWWEQWQDGFTTLAASAYHFPDINDTGSDLPRYTAPQDVTSLAFELRWPGEGCYHQRVLTAGTGYGKAPSFQMHARSVTSKEVAPIGTVQILSPDDCASVRKAPGSLSVRRGAASWRERTLRDACTMSPAVRRAWPLGRGLSVAWSGEVAILNVGLRGPARERVAVQIWEDAGTGSTKVFQIRRVNRPDRKVWEGTDEYWNYCIRSSEVAWDDIYRENGRYYCWRYAADSVYVTPVRRR